MQLHLKSFIQTIGVKVLVGCLMLAAPYHFDSLRLITTSFAQAGEAIPSGWESYYSRPDILAIPAKETLTNDKNWQSLKAAHFSFVAELLALYPADTNIYFLARDSEHLYDVARLVTDGTPDAHRIYLLNISRANMRDPNIKGYLNEFGISEETLSAGRKVLFVDTGFSGTIPRVIAENFTEKARQNLKTHLVVSSNSAHPSSRVFLIHINPSVNEQNPSIMHGSIVAYEHMARYTDRSSKIIFTKGQYHPISLINGASDGSVSKERSLSYMQDFKAEWQKPAIRQRFTDERHQFSQLKQMLIAGDTQAQAEVKDQLEKTKGTSVGRLLEAQVRDTFASKRNAGFRLTITEANLGLNAELYSSTTAQLSKKNDLIKKYPEWASVLENPEDMIPKLFKDKNWQMIGNLIDAKVDAEIDALLVKSLFDAPAVGAKKDLQIGFIETGDPDTLNMLAHDIFSQPHTKDMPDLIKLVIEKGDPKTLWYLAEDVFSKPHTKGMSDLIKLLIKKGDAETLHYLAEFTFSQPHTKDMSDLIKLLIEKGDPSTLTLLAQYTFSQPHNKGPLYAIFYQSLLIGDPLARKQYLDSELKKINSSLPASSKVSEAVTSVAIPTKAISSALQPGDKIQVNGQVLTVIKIAGEGRRGVVFQVKSDTGAFYALKTIKNNEPETLASLAKESKKALQWQALKIPHAKVLVQEKEYVLKTWIEGLRGDEVIEKLAAGDESYKPAAEALLKLVSLIRAQGAYVGDFRPPNLILVGNSWVIIDSGSIQQGMTLEEAQAKWMSADQRGVKFERRWKMSVPKPGPMKCDNVFLNAGQ